jgi:chromosome segregation ATPase
MDRLYGVTMEQKGISRLVGVNFEQANRMKKSA